MYFTHLFLNDKTHKHIQQQNKTPPVLIPMGPHFTTDFPFQTQTSIHSSGRGGFLRKVPCCASVATYNTRFRRWCCRRPGVMVGLSWVPWGMILGDLLGFVWGDFVPSTMVNLAIWEKISSYLFSKRPTSKSKLINLIMTFVDLGYFEDMWGWKIRFLTCEISGISQIN